MKVETTEEHTWASNSHNDWIAETFSMLCFQSLPSNQQPELGFLNGVTGYFLNLSLFSEEVFFKIVRDNLDQIPERQYCFPEPAANVDIYKFKRLIELDYFGGWSAFMFPDSNEWTFFFDYEVDMTLAKLAI